MKNSCVVADSSPLIALAKLKRLTLLNDLFSAVIIPAEVASECIYDLSRPGAKVIHAAIEAGQIKISAKQINLAKLKILDTIDAGEIAAIDLAMELRGLLLIDDKLGRQVAKKLGCDIIGTGGILVCAKKHNLIKKVKPLLEELKENGYRLSDDLNQQILLLANEK